MSNKTLPLQEALRLIALRDQIDTKFAGTVQRMVVDSLPRLAFVYDEFIFLCDEGSVSLVHVYPKSDDERTNRLINSVRFELETTKSGKSILDCARLGFVPDVLIQSLIDGDGTAKICQQDIADYTNALAKLA